MEEQIRQVGDGRPSLIFVEAESGGGKTRFLAEVALRGPANKMWVLRGRGRERVGERPFQVLHGIVQQVIVRSQSDPAFAATLRHRLGDRADAVAAVLPEMARALGWHEAATAGPENFAESWSIQALAAFLDALGAKDQPAMILLDDCQWADETTVKLIAHWRREQSGSDENRSALLLVAFRSEETAADHAFRKIRPSLHLHLAPFAAGDVRRLLESMAGPLPAEVVETVGKLSEGSPFMASAVLRGMAESGALLAGPEGWRLEPSALADLQSSGQAAGFLARRIELLPQDTLELLTIGAVLGKEFDLQLAAKLLEISFSQAVAALDVAQARHFVWIRPDAAECVFVHDKLRLALLTRLSVGDLQQLHHRVAHHLQREHAERIFDLAYHFDAAGDHRSALPHALRAAEQARGQYALEMAERQYRIAQRGAAVAERATRYGIAEGLGDVLMLRGRYHEAGDLFQSALRLAEGAFAEAQIHGKLGELDFKRGYMSRAAVAFEEGLRLLKKPIPKNTVVCVAVLVREAVVQAAHTWLPRFFVNRHNRAPSKTELLRLHLLIRLAYAYWFSRGRLQTYLVHLFGMNLAERYRPTAELAHIYASHAVAITVFGLFGRALAYAEKSLVIRRSLRDLWGEGQSLSFFGCVLYAASRFRECLEKCRQAVRLLERMGDYWEMHIALYQVAASLYRLGDLRGAREEARRMHKSGMELGDEQSAGISLDIWSLATGGMVPEQVLVQEVARKRTDAQAKAQVLLAQGVHLMSAGQHQRATAAFEEGLEQARQLGRLNVYVAPNLPWLATSLRRQAESQGRMTPMQRAELLARAEAVARRAVRVGRRLQNDLPHALARTGEGFGAARKGGACPPPLDEKPGGCPASRGQVRARPDIVGLWPFGERTGMAQRRAEGGAGRSGFAKDRRRGKRRSEPQRGASHAFTGRPL